MIDSVKSFSEIILRGCGVRVRASFEAGEMPRLAFGADDMNAVGEAAAEAQRERIGRGVDVNDLPALPLSKRWANTKRRLGLPPVRNWTVTGETLRALGVRGASDGAVEVGLAVGGAKGETLARENARLSQMVGLSPRDQERVAERQREIFEGKVRG